MYNHTAVAKAFATAACTLAIALLTIGMGVYSTWAGRDQSSGLNFTPISSKRVHQNGTKADKARRFAQACARYHEDCSIPPDTRFPCCTGSGSCQINPTANGRHWCECLSPNIILNVSQSCGDCCNGCDPDRPNVCR